MMHLRLTAAITLVLLAGIAEAATPPDAVNYQAVLRDASGNPLDGNFDMTFRLFDSEGGGNEILVDEHLTSRNL
ncbi:MAG: hypothetical protein OEV00_16125, partial [Acidobacteriota bacterium]|nr:hypothetical protein [Acidobacteriota bacterium]